MITKERQVRKMRNAIKKANIRRSLQKQKDERAKALQKRIEKAKAKGEERRAFRKKIGKANGVNYLRVKLTSGVEKGKASYIIK